MTRRLSGRRLSAQNGREAQRGHALLELALSAAVVLAFIAGTFQFGYAFYIYNRLVTAFGNGGRYAAIRTVRAATPGDIEKGKQAIRNMVVFGEPTPEGGALPVVKNLSTELVEVSYVDSPAGGPERVRVSLGEFEVNALFQKFRFKGRPYVEFPFVGRYEPAGREP